MTAFHGSLEESILAICNATSLWIIYMSDLWKLTNDGWMLLHENASVPYYVYPDDHMGDCIGDRDTKPWSSLHRIADCIGDSIAILKQPMIGCFNIAIESPIQSRVAAASLWANYNFTYLRCRLFILRSQAATPLWWNLSWIGDTIAIVFIITIIIIDNDRRESVSTGGRYLASLWAKDGILYLFGGKVYNTSLDQMYPVDHFDILWLRRYKNDVWKFENQTWTQLYGFNGVGNEAGSFNTSGLSIFNNPGARQGAVTWVYNDTLYLFGGQGFW